MKVCKVCSVEKDDSEFYSGDSTCKEDRKAKVRANRAAKAQYYREYDKRRYQSDPRVKERIARYQKTQAGAASARKSKAKWAEKNAIKKGAATIVGNAVRDGRLYKPERCSECMAGGRIHGHHDDYAFPLTVRWLCTKCHTKWHQENGEGLNG